LLDSFWGGVPKFPRMPAKSWSLLLDIFCRFGKYKPVTPWNCPRDAHSKIYCVLYLLRVSDLLWRKLSGRAARSVDLPKENVLKSKSAAFSSHQHDTSSFAIPFGSMWVLISLP
jgi:hypothetical protein